MIQHDMAHRLTHRHLAVMFSGRLFFVNCDQQYLLINQELQDAH
jgi:hypothetical protein